MSRIDKIINQPQDMNISSSNRKIDDRDTSPLFNDPCPGNTPSDIESCLEYFKINEIHYDPYSDYQGSDADWEFFEIYYKVVPGYYVDLSSYQIQLFGTSSTTSYRFGADLSDFATFNAYTGTSPDLTPEPGSFELEGEGYLVFIRDETFFDNDKLNQFLGGEFIGHTNVPDDDL